MSRHNVHLKSLLTGRRYLRLEHANWAWKILRSTKDFLIRRAVIMTALNCLISPMMSSRRIEATCLVIAIKISASVAGAALSMINHSGIRPLPIIDLTKFDSLVSPRPISLRMTGYVHRVGLLPPLSVRYSSFRR